MNNGDDKKNQQKAQDNANKNVKWNKPGEWKVDPNNPNREMRITTGDGTGEYYVGKKKMDPEKWAEWLKTPAGKRYTALQNVEKVEYRDINKTQSEIQSKAQPNTESMGSRVKEGQYDKGLRTEAQYEEVEISPGVYVYKKVEGTGGKVIPQEMQYTEVERTKPGERRDDLDQNTVISSTGDDKDVKNYLEEQQAEAQQGLQNIRNEEVTVKSSGG
jgi:hypothetical protein